MDDDETLDIMEDLAVDSQLGSQSMPSQNIPIHDSCEPAHLTDQEKDWQTIPEDMRNKVDSISLDRWGHEYLRVPAKYFLEMDGVSKCWKSIPNDSPSLLLNEMDGGVWAFCQGCVANIPKDLQEILYFFHMLQCHISNLNHYVVPTKNTVLR